MVIAETFWGSFFYMWIAFMGIMLAAVVGVLIWAWKSGRFKNQDRARYLPLDDAPPPRAGDGEE